MSPKFAIPWWVAKIALKYGKTVSEGIQKMEKIISGEDYGEEYRKH